jgi:hypothetical protein
LRELFTLPHPTFSIRFRDTPRFACKSRAAARTHRSERRDLVGGPRPKRAIFGNSSRFLTPRRFSDRSYSAASRSTGRALPLEKDSRNWIGFRGGVVPAKLVHHSISTADRTRMKIQLATAPAFSYL